MGLIQRIKDLILLKRYYDAKIQGYVIDRHYDKWEGATQLEIGSITMSEYDRNIDKLLIFRMVDAYDVYGKVIIKPMFDFDGFADNKPIRTCTFKEFVKIYGTYIISTLN